MSWETFFHLKYFEIIQDKLALIIFRCMVKISWDHLAVGFLLSPFFSSHALNLFFWHFHMQYTLKIVTCSFSYLLPTPITSHPSNISPTFMVFFVLFCDLLCLTKHVYITWGLLVFISAWGASQRVRNKRQCPVVLEHFPLFSVSWAIMRSCFCCISLQTEASLIRTESSACVWA